MEDDLEILERAILNLEATGEDDEDTTHKDLYKNWGKYGSQEERRKELLDIQKRNRFNKFDKFRGIMELVRDVEEGKLFKPYNKVSYRPSIYVAGFHKTALTYSNVLMLSEWLIEKPPDFDKNWYIAPCPKGTRMLVISYHGITKCYNKYGQFKFECWTSLPGGNPRSVVRDNSCVLDCFYYQKTNTMYVLDLLAWNALHMTDGETEFRQFWMKSHLDQISIIKTISKWNKMTFKLIPMIPCTQQLLNKFFSNFPPCMDEEFPPLDGLLFYHKEAHYVAGQTPLVGWLFPYMVSEVLGDDITVHPDYLAGRPHDYTNQAEFIQKFEADMKQQRNRNKRNSSMETDVDRNEAQETEEEKEKKETEVMESEDIVRNQPKKQSHDTAADMNFM